jgi:hypothetical protein
VQLGSWRIRATIVWFNFLNIKNPVRKEAPDSQQKNISFNNAPTGLDALVDHLFFIRDGVKASINILLS